MGLKGRRKFVKYGFFALITLALIFGSLIVADVIRFKKLGEVFFVNFSLNGSNLKFGSFYANSRYLAVKVRDAIGIKPQSIFIYDTESESWVKLEGQKNHSMGISFSRLDENIFYLSTGKVEPEKKLINKIYKCDLMKNNCSLVFSKDNPSHSFIDFPDGRLLFVSSPPQSGGEEQPFRYKEWDFYLRFPDGKIKQLTDLELYQLGSVNLTVHHGLFIDVYGDRKMDYSVGKDNAGVYRLEFDNRRNEIIIGDSLKKPFITYDEGFIRSAWPSILPESHFLGFMSRSSSNSRIEREFTWQSIIVHDLESGKNIDIFTFEEDGKLSAPKMKDNENLAFMITDDDKAVFYRRNFISKTNSLIVSVGTKDIDKLQMKEISY
ncbi:hypothetical protein NBZ79_11180 [Sneathiella marina]|uniref:Phytase-like domain-containing protein n=1 Tax=Sneathiella marina TaxID=2950108 RepID=A0ABY4VYB7_9PROT|nr:hypothetical protein [Sneathiella marina]USG59739.1 hypothetical protein NBZ79_11180 [Sneathiella marina]